MSDRERAKPKRAARDEDPDSSARKIQDDCRQDREQREDPDDPPFSSFAYIVLSAGKNHDRSEPEEICGLVPIWKWTETLLVVPERKRGVRQVKRNADRGQDRNSTAKQAQLKARLVKLQILRGDDIEPAQSSSEAKEIAQRDPRLRSERRWKLNSEVINNCRTPLRLKKPAGGEKGDCRQDKEAEKNDVRERAERKPRWSHQQVECKDRDDKSLLPFLSCAAQKASEHGQQRDSRISYPTSGSGILVLA